VSESIGHGPRVVPPVLVGRDAELAECQAAVSRAAGGIGGSLWVAVEAGIGKTPA